MLEMYIRTKKFLLKVEYLEKGGGGGGLRLEESIRNARFLEFIS